MSADLPDFRPETSIAMARMLVKTMTCDNAVRVRLREDFPNGLDLRTIKQIRIEEALGKMPRFDPDPFKVHEGYYPSEASAKAAALNTAFVRRLRDAYPERFAA